MSALAQIAQIPEALDFPRDTPPANLHYVGPLNNTSARAQLASRLHFPWDRLSGEPFVYAALGTLQNGLDWLFRVILDATSQLGTEVRLVLSLGGSPLDPASLGPLPPSAIVLPYVPQFDVLARASACITHAGLNTALDAITHGVPTISIPITNDQPGVAARLAHAGAGLTLALGTDDSTRLTPETLSAALRELLTTPTYRSNAQRLQQAIATLDPLPTAVALIESHLPS